MKRKKLKSESAGAVESYSLSQLKEINRRRGITLVALVVTIVVLLILAGITLMYVFGDNGVFSKAQDAKDETEQAKRNEQEYFNNVDNTINKHVEGNGGTTNPPAKTQKIAEIVGKKQDDTITVEDANKNKVTVPKGFTIVSNSGEKPADKTEEQWNAEKVVYSYNGDGTPTVQDGIVIEDEKGNQFVWVPVGTINNKQGDTKHGATSTITLGRYEDFTVKTDEDGNKYYQPKQTATQYKKAENSTQTDLEYQDTYKLGPGGTNNEYYMELTEKLEGKNEVAESLESFLESATTKGGYYLARYEASKGESNKPMTKANQTVWGGVTQPNAATYARDMYSATDPMESDLVNSYAWDTAIIFIQTYSEGNSDYANRNTRKEGSLPFVAGTSGDSVCNIHDMASNCFEWSTEYSTFMDSSSSSPCVLRGGGYISASYPTSTRYASTTSNGYIDNSFRPLCYVK